MATTTDLISCSITPEGRVPWTVDKVRWNDWIFEEKFENAFSKQPFGSSHNDLFVASCQSGPSPGKDSTWKCGKFWQVSFFQKNVPFEWLNLRLSLCSFLVISQFLSLHLQAARETALQEFTCGMVHLGLYFFCMRTLWVPARQTADKSSDCLQVRQIYFCIFRRFRIHLTY